jgi:hypothetical protein
VNRTADETTGERSTMSYEGLLGYARQLAGEAPQPRMLDLWKTQGEANKEAFPFLPSVDFGELFKKFSEEMVSNQACTICDLNAYLMMVTAAGYTRVEAMKAAIKARKPSRPSDAGPDRAYLFDKKSAEDFGKAVVAWSQLEGNGVMQLKFNPGAPGAHTFVVERVPPKVLNADVTKNKPLFRVYQAYEGTYRLADFLGVDIVRNGKAATKTDEFLKDTLKTRFGAADELLKIDSKSKFVRDKTMKRLKEIDAEAEAGTETFKATAKLIGRGNDLAWEELLLYVFIPLEHLLAGSLSQLAYQDLTGVPKKPVYREPHSTDWMIALICDTVSPNDFQGNFGRLVTDKGKIKGYVPLPEE